MKTDLLAALVAALTFGWGYYRLLRGTGLLIGGLLEVLVGLAVLSLPEISFLIAGILIFAAIIVEVGYQRRRKSFPGARLVYEGGGVRRGLMPVEVGFLFGLSEDDLVTLGLIELLQKGFVNCHEGDATRFLLSDSMGFVEGIINPQEKRQARKAAARKDAQVLKETEDILIELLRQHRGNSLNSFPAGIWVAQLSNDVEIAMGGFDAEKTCEYYDAFITHRLNGVVAGHFTPEEYTGWMALAGLHDVIPVGSLKSIMQKTHPVWLSPDEDFNIWLDQLLTTIRS